MSGKATGGALFYTQDQGGTKYLIPLLAKLLPRPGARVVAHPLSQDLLCQAGIPFEPLSEPPDEDRLRAWLRRAGISHVVCTLSARRDLTNALLIQACAAEGVPSYGFIDHWKGYERLLDASGRPRYAPDYTGCIDEHAQRAIVRIIGDPSRVHVVGHPQLERLLAHRDRARVSNRPRVLIISQPDDSPGGTWQSVFAPNSWRLLVSIAEAARQAGASACIRSHPKEIDGSPLPAGVTCDTSPSWEAALANYDVFVGVDSMLLVEAALTGRPCVCLRLAGVGDHSDELPYRLGETVRSEVQIAGAVLRAAAGVHGNDALHPCDLEHAVRGSLERGVRCIEEFLTQTTHV